MSKYLISYDVNVDQTTLESSLSTLGCVVLEKLNAINVWIVDAPNTQFTSIDGVLQYEVDADITVEPHWHLNRICSVRLPVRPIYVAKNKGEGATVYLVDSGIDTTHSELSNATIQHLWSWDNTFTDTNGHGTGLSSILVGTTLGVSPRATVKSVKIPFGQPVAISILLNAFNAILSDHLLTPGIKVVNCSWSVQKSIILDSKISELQQNGLIVVAAAGNNIIDANTLSPVGLDTVLGVAASDVYDRVISWGTGAGSNWGPDVDITAPGINVAMAMLDGSIQERSGTSIAAAVVSGVVCQYITDNPIITTAGELQQLIVGNSQPDILFRNESIYGTTPNRLIIVPRAELIASPSREDRLLSIQKGTTVEIPVTLNDPASSINIHNFTWGTIIRSAPDWISLADNVLTISPPDTLDTNLYLLGIEILNVDNLSIGYAQLSMKIYDVSDTEVDLTTPVYNYFVIPPDAMDETVIVMQSVCGGSCFSGCTGKGCYCSSSSFVCVQA
jgi:hypothetical protein